MHQQKVAKGNKKDKFRGNRAQHQGPIIPSNYIAISDSLPRGSVTPQKGPAPRLGWYKPAPFEGVLVFNVKTGQPCKPMHSAASSSRERQDMTPANSVGAPTLNPAGSFASGQPKKPIRTRPPPHSFTALNSNKSSEGVSVGDSWISFESKTSQFNSVNSHNYLLGQREPDVEYDLQTARPPVLASGLSEGDHSILLAGGIFEGSSSSTYQPGCDVLGKPDNSDDLWNTIDNSFSALFDYYFELRGLNQASVDLDTIRRAAMHLREANLHMVQQLELLIASPTFPPLMPSLDDDGYILSQT